MKALSHAEQLRWVQEVATIDDLIDQYPHEWATVHHKLSEIYTTGDIDSLQKYIKQETNKSFIAINSLKKETRNSKVLRTTSSQIVKARMVTLAVKNQLLKTSTGISHGKIRFNYFNGLIAQALFFSSDLKRKPVSISWFRIIWPLLWQKKFLMPLVQPKGIYCFYSKKLISKLSEIMKGKCCLEIAAGDGTLTDFLANAGVNITATDNYSWSNAITYPDTVIKMDAHAA